MEDLFDVPRVDPERWSADRSASALVCARPCDGWRSLIYQTIRLASEVQVPLKRYNVTDEVIANRFSCKVASPRTTTGSS